MIKMNSYFFYEQNSQSLAFCESVIQFHNLETEDDCIDLLYYKTGDV